MDSDFSLDEIDEVANNFLMAVKNRKVVAFHGEMGSGKTTFISAVCKRLGVNDNISSPTFSIINSYKTGEDEIIYHMDLYRIKDEMEAIAAGVDDCLYSGQWCLVEWPEKAPLLFSENTVHIYLVSTGINTRKLQINL